VCTLKADGVVPKGELPDEIAVCPKDGEEPKLNARLEGKVLKVLHLRQHMHR
jgi:hypothetical protein